jgi:hypothetical protein
MEQPMKKLKTSSRTSRESRKKENNKQKEARKFKNMFVQMLQKEFPDSKITNKDLPIFLFKLTGYDFNPETFQITQKPSKFGGIWKEEQPVDASVNQYKTSFLINQRLIELIYQPLCPCGANWSCKSAEGIQAQKTTNGIFHLLSKLWILQILEHSRRRELLG